MAAQLLNSSKSNANVANHVTFATSFLKKAFGLMGRQPLAAGEALYFRGTKMMPCNSIQTCFMRFDLDVIFLDSSERVLSVSRNVKPWRMTWPVSGAVHAIEMTSGSAEVAKIEIGDLLHVGD